MKRDVILRELRGGLWHTTHPDHFQAILKSGAILPDPAIPEKERFGTAIAEEGHPYVRTLGGVSLFDFDQFDPNSYDERYPCSSWAYFVPCQLRWDRAVWIEIDRKKVAAGLISGADLLAKWKAEKSYRRIMAEIEAAHLGPLPVTAFKRAFLIVFEENDEFQPLPLTAPPNGREMSKGTPGEQSLQQN